jgi:hypothetical protein
VATGESTSFCETEKKEKKKEEKKKLKKERNK